MKGLDLVVVLEMESGKSVNESVIYLCWPVITHKRRYWTMIAFLFCPCGVQVYHLLTQPMVDKEVVEHADDGVGTLPISTASSIR